jgi:branched-subunit amino acid aminotransferase/4-amino-4-deoxychorismate lyase
MAESFKELIPDTVAYIDGTWVSRDYVRLSVDDLGVRSGVIAVERLRTYGSRVFELDPHLERFSATARGVLINGLPPLHDLAELVAELLQRNASANENVGITLLATPGLPGGRTPTLIMHLNEIERRREQRFTQSGQTLTVTDISQPGPTSWSRKLKTRCRLHYYLADHAARQIDPDAVAVLVDPDGFITETSIANVAIVRDGEIISPARSRILDGITQRVVERLASQLNIPWREQDITPDELRNADEVLMMGTDNGVWFVRQVDNVPIGDGGPGRIFTGLRERFDAHVHGVAIA